jgi:hypothetical protein
MPLPDPADLAWMEDVRRERSRRRWLAENRGRIEQLIAKLQEARNMALGLYSADEPVPELIELAIWAAEEELEP